MIRPSAAPEILAFGEIMTMLVAEAPGKLADVEYFQRRIAGADTNVAIGLSRLGFHVGWLNRVGDNGFGTFIRQALEAEGLDCRHLRTLFDGLSPHEELERGNLIGVLAVQIRGDIEGLPDRILLDRLTSPLK